MPATFSHTAFAVIALCSFLVTGSQVYAEMISYRADLKGTTEVPPNDGKGTGTVDANYDTASKKLSWTVTYSVLSGPASAAHFHGPAAIGANASPLVPILGSLLSPIKGDATLTQAQATDLQSGLRYFNIHTAANKGGELRG